MTPFVHTATVAHPVPTDIQDVAQTQTHSSHGHSVGHVSKRSAVSPTPLKEVKEVSKSPSERQHAVISRPVVGSGDRLG